MKLALKALVPFALVELLSLLTDGMVVGFLQLNKVEGQRGDVAQADQEVKQSLPQQYRGPAEGDSENPQSEHGTGVDHQNPSRSHGEDVGGPLELMEQLVQLLHPLCIGFTEGICSTIMIIVESTEAGQVTVTPIVAVWHSGTDDDKEIHKYLHKLAKTWETQDINIPDTNV